MLTPITKRKNAAIRRAWSTGLFYSGQGVEMILDAAR